MPQKMLSKLPATDRNAESPLREEEQLPANTSGTLREAERIEA